MAANFDRVDIFPRYVSECIKKLAYPPEKNFNSWLNSPNVKVFIMFTDENNIVYYKREVLTHRYMKNISQLGRESKKFDKFKPRNINWESIANRYKRSPMGEMKNNADVRLGFKLNNQFLIKAFFTFGLRTVEKGTAHVIQTLNAPLLLYKYPQRLQSKCRNEEKVLPCADIHLYDMRILPPNGVYRISFGTRYVLFSTQKNYFSLDIVRDSMKMEFEFIDPIKIKISHIPNVYDRPPKTPYIEEENSDSSQDDELSEFFETTQNIQQTQNVNLEQNIQQTQNVNLEQTPQQITYLLIPNPPILERNLILASPEFVKNYHAITSKKLDDPNVGIFYSNPYEMDPEPMDLTICKINYPSNENSDQTTNDDETLNSNQALNEPTENMTGTLNEFCNENMNQTMNGNLNEFSNDPISNEMTPISNEIIPNENLSLSNENWPDLMELDEFLKVPIQNNEVQNIDDLLNQLLSPHID